ncbi:MAG TPA: hypothetical protein VN229_11350, partial [Terriglobales bacterium]|nr:hypothetical protein [Terriglobales bacterium]
MRRQSIFAILAGLVTSPAVADDRVPLDRQFFAFFNGRCTQSMNQQLQEQGKDPTAARYHAGIESYCGCTAQAVVSWLTAEEILQFANNPDQEPAAGKMRPYFFACRDKAQQAVQ